MQVIYQLIYNPFFNKILRSINKRLLPLLPDTWILPPSGTLRVQLGKTRFVLNTNQTSYVGKVLYYFGPDEFEYTRIFKDLIHHCQTFIDVGANFGYYSILAGKMTPSVKVHAFEPSPGPFYYLQKNVSDNQLTGRVVSLPIALSNHSGSIDFLEVVNPKYKGVVHNLGGVGRAGTQDLTTRTRHIRVECMTLDDYCASNNIKVDLIKMDTEGTEDQILQGASELIKKQKPIIICETLYNKIEDKLETILSDHGYLFFNHVSGKLVPVNTLSRDQDNGVRDCFFVHPDKVKLIEPYL